MTKRLLWVGDAACDSGFARCTHETLKAFAPPDWDVVVLGLNYFGDPHPYPYRIFPCAPGGDLFGVGRIRSMVESLRPDVVLLQNDPWNIPAYLKQIKAGLDAKTIERKPLLVGALAVDGKNCRGDSLLGLDRAIFWTQFAAEEARKGGWTGPSEVIPLGVDLETYKPLDRRTARIELGFPTDRLDSFVVGNVNRNQPRKRLDLTIRYFAAWVSTYEIPDAQLFLHVAPTGDTGYDVQQLAKYYGLKGRLILSDPGAFHGLPESDMAKLYSSFDVQISTTQGEGWGLCTMEGMACGVPQIVPAWSALGEWAKDVTYQVRCSSTVVTPNNINALGGVPDENEFVNALQELYRSRHVYDLLREASFELVQCPDYRWSKIGHRYLELLNNLTR